MASSVATSRRELACSVDERHARTRGLDARRKRAADSPVDAPTFESYERLCKAREVDEGTFDEREDQDDGDDREPAGFEEMADRLGFQVFTVRDTLPDLDLTAGP